MTPRARGGIVVEAAVGSLDDARAAVEGGADRLELCARLDLGGTTPAAALIAEVKRAVDVPVSVMVRPRGGDFTYTAAELDVTRRDIEMALAHGADGIVVGALDATGRVDERAMRDLIWHAGATPVTFHKAVDATPDLLASLDVLLALGVARVLTSGGAPTAEKGIETIAALVARAGKAIGVIAGGSVRGSNAREVVARSGVREVHARCGGDAACIRAIYQAVARASARHSGGGAGH